MKCSNCGKRLKPDKVHKEETKFYCEPPCKKKPKIVSIIPMPYRDPRSSITFYNLAAIDDAGNTWKWIPGKSVWILDKASFYTQEEYDKLTPRQKDKERGIEYEDRKHTD